MARGAEHITRLANFHDRTKIQHCDPIADGLHHRQIMADEQIGQSKLRLEVGQQVQHLSLHRNVQSGDWFIEDEDFGIGR